MMPSRNDEVSDEDFRYKMLLLQLEVSQISDTEALPLHMWLSDQASEQLQQQTISTAIGVESLTEQIKMCAKQEKQASAIAEQFGYLNQFSSLDFALSKAFYSNQKNVATDRDYSSPTSANWTDFRDSLAINSAILADTAKQALSNLKSIQIKKGRRTKEWRNTRICELADRLLHLRSCTQEESIAATTAIWNIYFPDDEINDSDTAGRIITREKMKRRTRGQNAAETG